MGADRTGFPEGLRLKETPSSFPTLLSAFTENLMRHRVFSGFMHRIPRIPNSFFPKVVSLSSTQSVNSVCHSWMRINVTYWPTSRLAFPDGFEQTCNQPFPHERKHNAAGRRKI